MTDDFATLRRVLGSEGCDDLSSKSSDAADFALQRIEEQLEAAVAEVVDLKIAADHHKMFWQKAEERERGLKEQLQSAPKLSFCAYCGVGFEWDGKGDSCPGCKRANDLQEQLEAVTRERDERLAVNVGLIAENTELKRKLANHPVSSAARHALGEDLIPATEVADCHDAATSGSPGEPGAASVPASERQS